MWRSTVFRFLLCGMVVYVGLSILVAMLQRSLIYYPTTAPEAQLLAEATVFGFEPWRDQGGAIVGWKSLPKSTGPAANRLVVFHGNAGYALHRSQYAAGFGQIDGGRTWEVYLFEYPGYGARPGIPGEEPFTAAGLAALELLRAADSRPIHVLGESIGSGLACAVAARQPQLIASVNLVTPFARLADVASFHYPFLPVKLILADRWDNAAALRNFHGPLAVRLASADEIIPAAQGRELFDQYTGPKRLWEESGASHNGLDFELSSNWWREVSDFVLSR